VDALREALEVSLILTCDDYRGDAFATGALIELSGERVFRVLLCVRVPATRTMFLHVQPV
jgi:hypothetical protein